jgi:hypothetical protein
MAVMNKKTIYDQNPQFDKKGKVVQNGVSNLDGFQGVKGVYRIFERDKLVYVGYSLKDLKGAIQSLILKEYRSKIGRYKLEYIAEPCNDMTCENVKKKAARMIKKHQPRDNQ